MLSFRRDARGRCDRSAWLSSAKGAVLVLSLMSAGRMTMADGWKAAGKPSTSGQVRHAQGEVMQGAPQAPVMEAPMTSGPMTSGPMMGSGPIVEQPTSETMEVPQGEYCPPGGGSGPAYSGGGNGAYVPSAPPGGYSQVEPVPYPRTRASLYPCPVQYTPSWQGGTVITNQAFAPHEMLYPHEYRAMYPPYYYKVKGGWVWTPFGMKQHESWKLQGTEVSVKYKSHISIFSGFCPPCSH